ncbi:unnamed protein product [Prunus brigantina]
MISGDLGAQHPLFPQPGSGSFHSCTQESIRWFLGWF